MPASGMWELRQQCFLSRSLKHRRLPEYRRSMTSLGPEVEVDSPAELEARQHWQLVALVVAAERCS